MIERYLKELRALEGLPAATACHNALRPPKSTTKTEAVGIFPSKVKWELPAYSDISRKDAPLFRWRIEGRHPDGGPYSIEFRYEPHKNPAKEGKVNVFFYNGPEHVDHVKWNISSDPKALQHETTVKREGKREEKRRLTSEEAIAIRRFLRDNIKEDSFPFEGPTADRQMVDETLQRKARIQIINWLKAIS